MTPSQAIKLNCRFCLSGGRMIPKCESKHCSFNRKGLSSLDRIRCGCHECAANHRPDECKGQIVGIQKTMLAEVMGVSADQAICPLYPYRLGKNPNRSISAEHLKAFRFTPQQGLPEKKETFSESQRTEHKAEAEIEAN